MENPSSVIEWFQAIENKQHHSFICFDIVEFYPPSAKSFSAKHLTLPQPTKTSQTTNETSSYMLRTLHKQQVSQKKGDTTFDVTMRSYDGAEKCELVGSFLLSQLQNLDVNIGLYRDDGLAISKAAQRYTENIKKEICRVFNQHGLRITIEANKPIINFLDVTFNLNNSTSQPFTKPNTKLSLKQGTANRGMGMGNWEQRMGNL